MLFLVRVKSGMLMNKANSGLLLDTHVWIWLNIGSSELKTKLIQKIDNAAANGELFVAAISIWEIATLVAKKKIILKTTVQAWIEEALSQPGVELIPLSPAISIESTQLPNGVHGDPADRIIIATARLHSLDLLTRDEKMLGYGNAGFLSVTGV